METKPMEAPCMGSDREKYWKELSIEEKIERLRTVVKSNAEIIHFLEKLEHRINQIESSFTGHAHLNNHIVVDLRYAELDAYRTELSRFQRDSMVSKPANPDEVYF